MFLDTPSKKRIIFSFISYFPIISLLAGAPIPLPSIFEPTQGQIALLNGVNLSISIIGAIIGVGFYLRNKSKKELEKLEEQIDESVLAVKAELKELHTDMKEMEVRICNSMTEKISTMEKHAQAEVNSAKELADTKIKNIEENINNLRHDIQNMERGYHQSNKYTKES